MARYTIVKMKNLSPLHIGNGKENYDFSSRSFQSDTISAALTALKAQKEKIDNLKDFIDSFKVSSAFPYYKDLFFFPIPQGYRNISIKDQEESQYRKKLKKVRFISFDLWKEIIKGKKIEIEEGQVKGIYIVEKKAINSSLVVNRTQVNQRVTIPRDGENDPTPFYFEWNFFDKDAGFYILLETTTSSQLEEIKELFKRLGENGIGTDKNIGGGKFDVEFYENKIEIENIINADVQLNLSLYLPTEEEMKKINLEDSKYSLLLRGGFISGSDNMDFWHLRKKSIYMFEVGSIFSTNYKLNGKSVDLRPEWEGMHPVYRSGKAIMIPIKSVIL